MVLIFNNIGEFVKEVASLEEASEITGCTKGNISQITSGLGNISSHGYVFIRRNFESEIKKQAYIDNAEIAIKVILSLQSSCSLSDKIDKVLSLIK